ncbi:MAG TPA: ester cyclase [Candidatus Limnocylindria bacterium]|nr:ester cyclase [Candidatus Limnocylindria bacterium]
MSIEQNKDIARRFIQEVFVNVDPSAVDELATEDFTPHSWGEMPPGRDSLKAAQQRVMQGLSDASMTVEDVIAEGDKVVVRLTSHGRHDGEFMGMPASGKEYSISEIHIFRIADGKVAEHWRDADMLGMMQQLGAMPTPAAAGSR